MKAIAKFKLFPIHKIIFIKAASLMKVRSPKKHKGSSNPVLLMVVFIKIVMSVKLGWVRMEGWNKFVYEW